MPSEWIFFQHSAVPVCKYHVEKEVEPECAEKQKCCEDPPHLEQD